MLTLDSLTVSYGRQPVLESLSLEVRRGEMVAVMGRNAVGKSTMLKAIMGLLPARSGRLVLDGEDITATPAHRRARRGLGYVAQGRPVFAELSVRENLLLGAELAGGEVERRIEAALEIFPKLAARLGQTAGTLSGGEQQQLAIGRALAGEPRVLLLDEPSAGVQPGVVDEIVECLRGICAGSGLPLVLVEHNVEMVSALCTRICVMKHGQVAAEVDPAQIHDESMVRAYLAI